MTTARLLVAVAALALVLAAGGADARALLQQQAAAVDPAAFTFYAGRDTQGYDLRQVAGATVAQLAAACTADVNCNGFNTWGVRERAAIGVGGRRVSHPQDGEPRPRSCQQGPSSSSSDAATSHKSIAPHMLQARPVGGQHI